MSDETTVQVALEVVLQQGEQQQQQTPPRTPPTVSEQQEQSWHQVEDDDEEEPKLVRKRSRSPARSEMNETTRRRIQLEIIEEELRRAVQKERDSEMYCAHFMTTVQAAHTLLTDVIAALGATNDPLKPRHDKDDTTWNEARMETLRVVEEHKLKAMCNSLHYAITQLYLEDA